MSNELTINPILHSFMDEEFGRIRIVFIDGKVYFVAKDISDILGYVDAYSMTRRLKETEIKKVSITILSPSPEMVVGINIGAADSILLINESGFYRSIFGSTKEFAEKFKDKVFEVILPTIRKTGSYSVEQSLHQTLVNTLKQVREEKELATQVTNKLLHILTYATDYRTNQDSTNKAFSTIQNIIHIVATGFTAKELKLYRSDSTQLHCGLQNPTYGKRGDLNKAEAKVGRNYLSKKELEREKQFVILILTTLDLEHELNQYTFTINSFVEFVWEVADRFCQNRDIPDISPLALDKYVDTQVSTYNQNRQLCESGNKLFLESKNPNLVPVLA